jgi:hypothetical protein
VALVTQDVALAGNASVVVTYDNVTGVVSTIRGTNSGSVSARFQFTDALGTMIGVIPAGSNNGPVLLSRTPPVLLLNVIDSTWDWDYSILDRGWSLDGS